MLHDRNWFTIVSLATLVALVLYSVFIVVAPSVTWTETEIGVVTVLGVSSIVTAILSLHFLGKRL